MFELWTNTGAMSKTTIYLTQWQAVELFCRLVTKFEADKGRKIGDFQNNEFLAEKLAEYGTSQQKEGAELILSLQLSQAAIGLKTDEKGRKVLKRPREIYELSRKIRYSAPIVLNRDESWRPMLEYINDEEYTQSVRAKKLTAWEPNDKQRRWEGQSWWMYFYDKNTEGQNGVTRAVLKFGTFAKAEIIGYRTDTDLEEGYVGSFKIHSTHLGKNSKDGGDTITLQMKLKETGEKDLHIRIYIGTGTVTLALGQFNNSGSQSFYTGTVMIEKIPGNVPTEARTSEFFLLDENGRNRKLPAHVCKFFRYRVQNIQRVPKVIRSIADFDIWHKSKNPQSKPSPPAQKKPISLAQKQTPAPNKKRVPKKTSTRKRGKP